MIYLPQALRYLGSLSVEDAQKPRLRTFSLTHSDIQVRRYMSHVNPMAEQRINPEKTEVHEAEAIDEGLEAGNDDLARVPEDEISEEQRRLEARIVYVNFISDTVRRTFYNTPSFLSSFSCPFQTLPSSSIC